LRRGEREGEELCIPREIELRGKREASKEDRHASLGEDWHTSLGIFHHLYQSVLCIFGKVIQHLILVVQQEGGTKIEVSIQE
jgi:hypothetical protein